LERGDPRRFLLLFTPSVRHGSRLGPDLRAGKENALQYRWFFNSTHVEPRGSVMNRTITAHFDGKVIVPEEPVKLPVGTRLRVHVELAPAGNGKQGDKRRKIIGTGKFNSGIPDLATNKKHMEGFGTS
jgi:hypothetical protein